MPDRQLPTNINYIFIPGPLTIEDLRSILGGIELDTDEHPVNSTYPTNSWVIHVYSAVTEKRKKGYAILYDIPPADNDDQHPVQVSLVNGATEDEKVKAAALIVGSGNELIGYEDMSGAHRAVIFRNSHRAVQAPSYAATLSWNSVDHLERDSWSTTLLSLVTSLKQDLEAGNPDGFLAGYSNLSVPLQTKFWAELIVAVAKFESDWRPNDIYHEPPPLNRNSIGLLQLSMSDQNSSAYSLSPRIVKETQLQDPQLNLGWGLKIFAHWLSRDGLVAQGTGRASRGAARYWSVLRDGPKVNLIKALTKSNIGL